MEIEFPVYVLISKIWIINEHLEKPTKLDSSLYELWKETLCCYLKTFHKYSVAKKYVDYWYIREMSSCF